MKTTIIYSSNDSYAMLSANSIHSLVKQNRSVELYKILLFSNKICDENKKIILNLTQNYHVDFEIIELGDSLDLIANSHNLSSISGNYNTYLTLFLNTLYPNFERVLFIDSDTVITGSIVEIFDFDLKGKIVAGVIDVGVYRKNGHYEDQEILNQTKNYFNAGVLLIDFNLWRKYNFDRKVFDLISQNPRKIWKNQEQSILNVLLSNYYTPLHSKYNFYSLLHLFSYKTLRKIYNIHKFMSLNEFIEASNQPVIIHFVAPYYFRPWYKNSISPFKSKFTEIVQESKIRLNLSLPDPKYTKLIYKFFDKINFILLNLKFYKFYFIIQRIISGKKKRAIIRLFGLR